MGNIKVSEIIEKEIKNIPNAILTIIVWEIVKLIF